jgi:hypothetical protein
MGHWWTAIMSLEDPDCFYELPISSIDDRSGRFSP